MRIISGLARGIRLQAPPGRDVRPTGDRIKEAIFASLGDLAGQIVVDLFAGSGALGLEAVSRGAEQVVLVERNPKILSCIKTNLAAVCKAYPEAEGKVRILRADAASVSRRLPQLAGKVDLLLADPPYKPDSRDYGGEKLLADRSLAEWAGTETLLMLEHATGTALEWFKDSPWHMLRTRRYGNTSISFARTEEEQ